MKIVCASILLGALLAVANAQVDKSMIPPEVLTVMNKCAGHAGIDIDEVLADCMIMEEENYAKCGKFGWCMGLEFELIDKEGNIDMEKAASDSKKMCDQFGLEVDLDAMQKCTVHCTDAYTAKLPSCGSQEEKEVTLSVMMNCIVEDCVMPMF